ncbi:glycosyltransferase family 39 protein [Microcoleus sp. BR0-C5]|uniref:glycosyltransferase family 39 protein n=1 Tax=Microcoleus sp. BR0-C5 TaxID=2818713 RepID=UPI002FD5270F
MRSWIRYEEQISRHSKLILFGILLAGFLLRLYGIKANLPDIYSNGEAGRVSNAVEMLANRDLNPHWFGHPATTVIYLLVFVYACVFLAGRVLGIFASADDFKALYFQDQTIFFLSGRLLGVLFGLITIWLVYLVGKRIFNRTVGLVAAALIAITPIHVSGSQLARMDSLMPLLLLLSFWLCLRIFEKNKLLDYVLASFLLGLAIVTKYPAVVFALTIILTFFLSKGWLHQGLVKVFSSIAACIAGAFVGSPFLFIDFKQVLIDVAKEARSEQVSVTGGGLIANLRWYIENPLVNSFSIYGILLLSIGFLFCAFSKRKEALILISFPLIFLIFISFLSLRWNNWVIPILPFSCIILSWAIYQLSNLTNKYFIKSVTWIFLFSFCIILASLSSASLAQGREASGTDTRIQAERWVTTNIQSGSALLIEPYGPNFPKSSFKLFQVDRDKQGALFQIEPNIYTRHAKIRPLDFGRIGEIGDIEDIEAKGIQYMVISHWYDLYLAEKERYPEIVKNYQRLISSAQLIYEFNPVPKINRGPKIRVYEFK